MKNNLNPKQQLGKYGELTVTARLIDEGREVYFPAVDDHGIDMMIITRDTIQGDGSLPEHYPFQEIQVKTLKEGGLFVFTCRNPRPNYWFVFYVKATGLFWLINSVELVKREVSSPNHADRPNEGAYTVSLATRTRITPKNERFLVKDFDRIP